MIDWYFTHTIPAVVGWMWQIPNVSNGLEKVLMYEYMYLILSVDQTRLLTAFNNQNNHPATGVYSTVMLWSAGLQHMSQTCRMIYLPKSSINILPSAGSLSSASGS